MRTNTAPISREALLAEANNIIRQHEDYLHGMIATDVEQKRRFSFPRRILLDADGLPTAKTTAVFNMFKHLAHLLSEKYHLVD